MTEDIERPAGLADAETYVEASDRPIAGGCWHILTDGSVLYERRPGEYEPAVLTADTLRSNATWRRAN